MNKNKFKKFKKLKNLIYILQDFFNFEPKNTEDFIKLFRRQNLKNILTAETLAMLEGALTFANMQVRDIMLPKKQMLCIDKKTPLETLIKIVTSSGHSRFPITDDHENDVIGILHAKDLLRYQSDPTLDFDLSDIVRQTTFVPESKRLDALLNDFRHNRNHMAIVVDEYGSVSGFVTLEDVIEQIVGDIEDEFDIDEEAYIKTHDSYHIIKAHTPIEAFNNALNAEFSDEKYDTIGGILMAKFGHLPKQGDKITIDSFEFKIINADARRINLIHCIDKRNNLKC